MDKIIGADGREYGPVNTEQLFQSLTEASGPGDCRSDLLDCKFDARGCVDNHRFRGERGPNPERVEKASMTKEIPCRARRIVEAVGLSAAGLVMVAVLFCFEPTGTAIYPVCLFHKFTGLNCPGCGSLRALHHLTHGDFAAAFHCNPLLIVALAVMVLSLVRRQFSRRGSRFDAFVVRRQTTFWAICAIVILFGVLRNVPSPAFAWMSP